MNRYDDALSREGHGSMILLVLLLGIVITVGALAIFFTHPEVIDNTKELSRLNKQIEQLQIDYQAQVAMTDDYEKSYYEEKSRADAAEKQRDDYLVQRNQYKEQLDSQPGYKKAAEQAKEDLEAYKAAEHSRLLSQWHFSFGGFVANPTDRIDPCIELHLGVGRGRWQVLGGVDLDVLDGMSPSVKLGIQYTW